MRCYIQVCSIRLEEELPPRYPQACVVHHEKSLHVCRYTFFYACKLTILRSLCYFHCRCPSQLAYGILAACCGLEPPSLCLCVCTQPATLEIGSPARPSSNILCQGHPSCGLSRERSMCRRVLPDHWRRESARVLAAAMDRPALLGCPCWMVTESRVTHSFLMRDNSISEMSCMYH